MNFTEQFSRLFWRLVVAIWLALIAVRAWQWLREWVLE